MSNEEISKYKQILDDIENEHKSDLAIHLYSTTLLKNYSDFSFPESDWYSWPLPQNEVPIPNPNYVKNPDEFEHVGVESTYVPPLNQGFGVGINLTEEEREQRNLKRRWNSDSRIFLNSYMFREQPLSSVIINPEDIANDEIPEKGENEVFFDANDEMNNNDNESNENNDNESAFQTAHSDDESIDENNMEAASSQVDELDALKSNQQQLFLNESSGESEQESPVDHKTFEKSPHSIITVNESKKPGKALLKPDILDLDDGDEINTELENRPRSKIVSGSITSRPKPPRPGFNELRPLFYSAPEFFDPSNQGPKSNIDLRKYPNPSIYLKNEINNLFRRKIHTQIIKNDKIDQLNFDSINPPDWLFEKIEDKINDLMTQFQNAPPLGYTYNWKDLYLANTNLIKTQGVSTKENDVLYSKLDQLFTNKVDKFTKEFQNDLKNFEDSENEGRKRGVVQKNVIDYVLKRSKIERESLPQNNRPEIVNKILNNKLPLLGDLDIPEESFLINDKNNN